MTWRLSIFLLLFLHVTGCVQPLAGKDVPVERLFYYPGKLTGLSDGSVAWLVNQNFDQAYRSGWITRIDVNLLLAEIEAGRSGRAALRQEARVLSLSGDFMLNEARGLAYLGHRGSGRLSVLALGPDKTLSCDEGAGQDGMTNVEQQTQCDREHLIRLPQVLQAFDRQKGANAQKTRDLQAEYVDLSALTEVATAEGDFLLAGYLDTPRLPALLLHATPPFVTPARMLTLEGRGINKLVARPLMPGRFLGASLVHPEENFDQRETPKQISPSVSDIDLAMSPAVKQAVVSKYSVAGQIGGYKASTLVTSPNDSSVLFLSGREGTHFAQRDVVACLRADTTPLVDRAPDGELIVSARERWQTRSTYVLDRGQITDMIYFRRTAGDLLIASSLMRDELYFFDIAFDKLTLVKRISLPGVMGPHSLRLVGDTASPKLLISTFFDHGLAVVDVAGDDPENFGLLGHMTDADDEPVSPRSR